MMLTRSQIDAIATAAAVEAPGPAGRAVLAAISELPLVTINYDVRTLIWSAAMTLAYGPTGLHSSRCDADGHPTAETVAAFPEIAESWARAREHIENALDVARREAQ